MILLVDLKTKKEIPMLQQDICKNFESSVQITKDNKYLISLSSCDGSVKVWEIATKKIIKVFTQERYYETYTKF